MAWFDDLRGGLRAVSDGLAEFYAGPYRAALRRAARDEDDLFMMLVMGEALGVPNPASHHTLELLPVMYDRFHDWHRRMGMERSPVEGLSCC
ncbi:cory-CC-star protein [Corynebacterium pygosceleis]|uniref:DNA helicase n=1 Tax=Corynebacterium pygosceleis TaxID=2800406 RepID=A0ABT3WSF0_9CORY|nr:cory-CC-star protein [Corynebacterium pygosceleis]MCK7676104.1 DNA helicase [Corynebacterium pygosceleis]MCX7445071.1 DNA helicase [Corynebacterium pygosceleis]